MRTVAEHVLRIVIPTAVLALMVAASHTSQLWFGPADAATVNQITAIPTMAVTLGSTMAPVSGALAHAVFDDANVHDASTFEALIRDIKARGFAAVTLVNGGLNGNDALLTVSDRIGGISVYLGAADEWNDYIEGLQPDTITVARTVAYPVADRFSAHPSFAGYYIRDEPSQDDGPKVRLIARALSERDPGHARFATLAGTGSRITANWSSDMTILALSVFPARAGAAECDFSDVSGTGQSFAQYVAARRAETSQTAPLLLVLQAHNGGSVDPRLRYPTLQEMRAQARLAGGLGASLLSWFIYTSQQDWQGLRDSPDRYNEAERIARGTQGGPSCDGGVAPTATPAATQAAPGPASPTPPLPTSTPTTRPTMTATPTVGPHVAVGTQPAGKVRTEQPAAIPGPAQVQERKAGPPKPPVWTPEPSRAQARSPGPTKPPLRTPEAPRVQAQNAGPPKPLAPPAPPKPTVRTPTPPTGGASRRR